MSAPDLLPELGGDLLARLCETGQSLPEIQARLRAGIPIETLFREVGEIVWLDPDCAAELTAFLRGHGGKK